MKFVQDCTHACDSSPQPESAGVSAIAVCWELLLAQPPSNPSFTFTACLSAMSQRPSAPHQRAALCAQARTGVPAACAARRCVEAAALAAQLPCRLGLHAYLTASVIAHPRAFAARSYYWVAAAGCAYVNAVNLRQAALAARRWRAGRARGGAEGFRFRSSTINPKTNAGVARRARPRSARAA